MVKFSSLAQWNEDENELNNYRLFETIGRGDCYLMLHSLADVSISIEYDACRIHGGGKKMCIDKLSWGAHQFCCKGISLHFVVVIHSVHSLLLFSVKLMSRYRLRRMRAIHTGGDTLEHTTGLDQVAKEIQILGSLNHFNIISLIEVILSAI